MKSKPRPLNPTGPSWKLLSLVILVELVYLVFFYSQRLTNAPPTPGEEKPLTRATLAAMSIPGLLPHNQSLVSLAVQRLAESPDLAARVPLSGWTVLIVLAAGGLGRLMWLVLSRCFPAVPGSRDARGSLSGDSVWHDRVETMVFSQGLGMNALSLAMLGLGLLGWMSRPVILCAVVALAIVSVVMVWIDRRAHVSTKLRLTNPARDRRDPGAHAVSHWEHRIALTLIGIAAALFMGITFLGAILPATDFDVREYHLQGPKEFFLTGRITFSPDNVYRNMPFGSEMLSLLSMIVVGDWWWGGLVGQAVLSMWGIFNAMTVYALGRRLFDETAGWLGAIIYLSTPWVYRISVIPYTENSLAFYLLISGLAFHGAMTSDAPGMKSKYWLLAGYFAGAAVSCKYTAVLFHVLPLCVAAAIVVIRTWRSSDGDHSPQPNRARNQIQLIAFLLLGISVATPWLARNWFWTGNPTYPLLYGVFGGDHWDATKNRRWEWGHRVAALVALGIQRPPPGSMLEPNDPQHSINLRRLGEGIFEVTAKSDWLSPLLFGLAPLALLRGKDRPASRWMWIFVLFYFVQWWLMTHRLNRFWVPMIPVVAVLAGGGSGWTKHSAWRSFLWFVIPSVVFLNFSYATTTFCAYNDFGQRLVPRTDPIDPAINWMNEHLPKTATILSVGEAALFHLDRAVLYNTVFDGSLWEDCARGRTPAQTRDALERRGVTHIYINWHTIRAHRQPRGYGYAEFVQPSTFRPLVDAGVLRRITIDNADQAEFVQLEGMEVAQRECYEVIPPAAE